MTFEFLNETKKGHISSGKFSISSIGKCWYEKYMSLKGLWKPTFDERTMRIFDIGDAFHQMMVKEFYEKGDAANIRIVAAEVDIPTQKYVSGRADIIISDGKTGELNIVDVKSCSKYTFSKVSEGDYSGIQNYIYQVNLYLHFFDIQKGYLLFVNKGSAEICEVEVKHNKTLADKQIKEIEDFFINNVGKDVEPPKCDGSIFGCECCGVEGSLGKSD